MFESLDLERTFVQDGQVTRTHVRRRILAVAVAVSVAALVGGQAADAATHGRRSAGSPGSAPPLTYVVAQGDTLWAISQRFLPGRDPRDGVQEIEQASHLSGPDVSPGQQLTIPTST
jgi:LysM repeat protein